MSRVEVSAGWNYGDRYATVVIRVLRWWRFGIFLGTPPGSHIGVWRTRCDGLRGINVRVGRRYVGPCLTVLAHTRSYRDGGR